MILDINPAIVSLAVNVAGVVIICILGFVGHSVYRELKRIFGAGRLNELIECLHSLAGQVSVLNGLHGVTPDVLDHHHVGKGKPPL